MFLEVLEKNKGKRMITAVVTEGKHQGCRGILEGGKIIYGDEMLFSGFFDSGQEITETCYREINGEKVFFEVLGQKPRLVVCGGGHVAIAVVKLARFLCIPVTVIEDRPLFANQARQAEADEVICDSFEHALEGIEGGPDTYFVIVTRGHRYDKVCLEAILNKPYAYAGMMGSRSRVRLLKQVMVEEGFLEEQLCGLHAPIGLDIHSETPEEIAVSILGEIIAAKNAKKSSEGYSDEILEGLKQPGRKALATIVMRKGSAPRQIGTKMVIFPDGTFRGTIGGGCAEAELMQKARELLSGDKPEPVVVRVNMTNREAEQEGMVCGGIQDIFLEVME